MSEILLDGNGDCDDDDGDDYDDCGDNDDDDGHGHDDGVYDDDDEYSVEEEEMGNLRMAEILLGRARLLQAHLQHRF